MLEPLTPSAVEPFSADESRPIRSKENSGPVSRSLAQRLELTFGARFSFWRGGTQWTRYRECETTDVDGLPVDESLGAFYDRLESVREDARRPALNPLAVDRYQLLVPVYATPHEVIIGAADITTTDPERIAQLASVFMKQLSLEAELGRFREENALLVDQVSRDFEELTFLRSIADHLDATDAPRGLIEMSATMFPLLNGSIGCEALVLIPSEGVDDSHPAALDEDDGVDDVRVAAPAYWYGAKCINEETCLRLVREFWRDAEHQPVVVNRAAIEAYAPRFSGVTEFVLVRLANDSTRLGWLLAVNRQPHLTNLGIPLSQFEFGTSEASLLESVASILTMHASNLDLLREKENLLVNVVRAMVTAIDAKDPYTRGHSERVAIFSRELAKQVGCSEKACERIYLAGLLHDVGKIGVSDETLGKPGRLDDDERRHIERHPEKGWDILHDLEQLDYVLPGVLHHHERYDGRGYPDQLEGDAIPLDARIMAIVDAYDAMTSDRPYRPGMPQEKAEVILREGAGSQWDPRLINAFFEIMPEIIKIRDAYQPKIAPARKPAAPSDDTT